MNFGSYFNRDISFQTLYGEDAGGKRPDLTVDGVFNAMPGI